MTLSQTTNFRLLPNAKSLQMTISNVMKMAESSLNGQKTLWEKEKLVVTSNFSFSHSVFKRPILQTRKNQGLFGKRSSRKYCLINGLDCMLNPYSKILLLPKLELFAYDKFNPFPNKPWFLRLCSTCLLKTLWEKGNCSFSHSVYYLFIELSAILIKLKIVICKLFQFGRV